MKGVKSSTEKKEQWMVQVVLHPSVPSNQWNPLSILNFTGLPNSYGPTSNVCQTKEIILQH